MQVVLQILRLLPRRDLLTGRLVSSRFIPRNIRVGLWILEESTHLLIGLNLSCPATNCPDLDNYAYQTGAEFDITKEKPSASNLSESPPGFLIHYEFDKDKHFNLTNLPNSLVTKIRFLTVGK